MPIFSLSSREFHIWHGSQTFTRKYSNLLVNLDELFGGKYLFQQVFKIKCEIPIKNVL